MEHAALNPGGLYSPDAHSVTNADWEVVQGSRPVYEPAPPLAVDWDAGNDSRQAEAQAPEGYEAPARRSRHALAFDMRRAAEAVPEPVAPQRPPPAAVPEPGKRLATSAEWCEAVLGSATIVLTGFGEPERGQGAVPPSWVQLGQTDEPLAPHLDQYGGVAKDEQAASARIAAFLAYARGRTLMILFPAVAALFFAFGAGILAWYNASRSAQREQVTLASLPAWRVASVEAGGVTIAFAQGRIEQVAVGGTLPNGERLLEADPLRHMYRTSTTAALVKAPEAKQP